MDLLEFVDLIKNLSSHCFLCLTPCKVTIGIDDYMEIHDEISHIPITLRNMFNDLFSPFKTRDVFLNQACENCTRIIIMINQIFKMAAAKRKSIQDLISKIDKVLDRPLMEQNRLIINLKHGETNEHIIDLRKVDTFNDKLMSVNYNLCKPKTEEDDFVFNKIPPSLDTFMCNRNIKCNICGKIFKNTDFLNLGFDCRDFKCPQCLKVFTKSSDLRKSIIDELKPKKKRQTLICNDCNYQSKRKIDLSYHMYKCHLHIKPYTCSLCNKKFFRRSNLKEHIVTHRLEKEHTCEICGDQFTCEKSLTNHLKLHLGKREFQCDICDRRFITLSRKNEHVKARHEERTLACKYCNKMYRLGKQLNKHMKTSHNVGDI